VLMVGGNMWHISTSSEHFKEPSQASSGYDKGPMVPRRTNPSKLLPPWLSSLRQGSLSSRGKGRAAGPVSWLGLSARLALRTLERTAALNGTRAQAATFTCTVHRISGPLP
jgi:hypothetical protein